MTIMMKSTMTLCNGLLFETISCSSNTVAGNVDSFNNVATWNGKNFSYVLDTSVLENGNYCFVFNPTDDAGENNVRETLNFSVDNTVIQRQNFLIVKKNWLNNDKRRNDSWRFFLL